MSSWAAAAWFAALAFFLVSIAAVLARRPRRTFALPPQPLTIIVPLKGASPSCALNLASLVGLPFAGEIILAVADAGDPAHALAAPLAAAQPERVRLLTGEDRDFANPKLRNVAKAYRDARHDTIVFFDETIAADAELLAELAGRLAGGARAVTAAPLNVRATNWVEEVEAATCNGYVLRIEAALDLAGLAAGFGTAFAFRKSDLDAAGGLARLDEGPCEDNALSRALRGLGGGIELAQRHAPRIRRVEPRAWREVALRLLRWKCCTKCHDPAAFLVEVWIGGLAFHLLGAAGLAPVLGAAWWVGIAASAAIWYGGELVLHIAVGWPLTWRSPAAWILRDLAHPALTLAAAVTRAVEWRGVRIDTRWRRAARARR